MLRVRKIRVGKSFCILVPCTICGATPTSKDALRALVEHNDSNKCVYCGKAFRKTTFAVSHEIADGHHKAKWYISDATAPVNAVSEIRFYPDKKVAFAHPKCLRKAFPYWRTATYDDVLPADEERLAGMADVLVERTTDAVIKRGLNTKAIEDVKQVLHVSLSALHKNVVGSSSEFGCPCAARVSATLHEIACKFQNKKDESGI